MRSGRGSNRTKNALISKINPHDIYSKIIQHNKSKTEVHSQIESDNRQIYKDTSQNILLNNKDTNAENEENKIGVHSETVHGVQYFTLFNKTLRHPNPTHIEKPKKLNVKSTVKKHKEEIPIKLRSYKRENIQLDTVFGKLLNSYVKMKPKVFDPTKPLSKVLTIIGINSKCIRIGIPRLRSGKPT